MGVFGEIRSIRLMKILFVGLFFAFQLILFELPICKKEKSSYS